MIASRPAYIARFHTAFPRLDCTGAYNLNTRKSTTVVNRSISETKCQPLKTEHALFKLTKHGVKIFITAAIDKMWFIYLKDKELFYTNVSDTSFLQHLHYRSGGLHAIDAVNLTDEIMTYYKEAVVILKYINMLEEYQLKSKLANLPISNDTLISISTKAVLTSDDFTRTTDEWEDIENSNKTWSQCKEDYSKAHTKCALCSKEAGKGDHFSSKNLTHKAHPLHIPDSGPNKAEFLSQLDHALENIVSDSIN